MTKLQSLISNNKRLNKAIWSFNMACYLCRSEWWSVMFLDFFYCVVLHVSSYVLTFFSSFYFLWCWLLFFIFDLLPLQLLICSHSYAVMFLCLFLFAFVIIFLSGVLRLICCCRCLFCFVFNPFGCCMWSSLQCLCLFRVFFVTLAFDLAAIEVIFHLLSSEFGFLLALLLFYYLVVCVCELTLLCCLIVVVFLLFFFLFRL